MKYTRTAIGLLTRQYRSVLQKCALINLGLFILTAPATAATTVTTYDALVAALSGSSTADVILDRSGGGINLAGGTTPLRITENQKVTFQNIGTAGSSSWNNGSGPVSGRTPSASPILNKGTLSVEKVIFDDWYLYYNDTDTWSPGMYGIIQNSGHITAITDTDFTNSYLTTIANGYNGGGFGGIISNTDGATIDLIKNVTVKNIEWRPKTNAPHGLIANRYHIDTVDGVVFENNTLIAHAPESATDTTGGGGNHSIYDNQNTTGIGVTENAYTRVIKNSVFRNNYLYKPGAYDITAVYENNHASAAGIYNQSNIGLIQNVLFENNHTKTDIQKEDSSSNAGGGVAIMTFKGGATVDDGSGTLATGYVGIGKIDNVQFIHNYAENWAGSRSGGAVYSGQGKIGEFTNAYFERNSATSIASFAYGGAISNEGTIDTFSGEFLQNYVSAATNANGGAIRNASMFVVVDETVHLREATFAGITADFSQNYALSSGGSAYGGAIYTTGATGAIVGNFSKNYVRSTATGGAVGGAIMVQSTASTQDPNVKAIGSVASLTGNFSENYAHAKDGSAYGGAIRNKGTIGNINGDFTSNYTLSEKSDANGGAISNDVLRTIGAITKSSAGFSQNSATGYTTARGGAIYNYHAGITSISAPFSQNHAESTNGGSAEGGAIMNFGGDGERATVGAITGNFSGNYVLTSGRASGGAINNNAYADMAAITGNFTQNYAKSTGTDNIARGGAVVNSEYITSISGNFSGNYAWSAGTSALGGAIYNVFGNRTTSLGIGMVSGTFDSNYTQATGSGFAQGGAVYNGEGASITFSASTFQNNNATSATNNASTLGGAIYNEGNITFSGTNTFSNNYQQAASTKTYNDIYNKGSITVSANGTLNINDGISGSGGTFTLNSGAGINLNAIMGGNSLTMNSASVIYGSYTPTGSSKTYGNLSLSALTVNSGAGSLLNSANSYIADSTLGTVKLSADLNYTPDINTANQTADKLIISSVASGSTGNIKINSFNVTSGTALADITDKNFKVQILQAPNNNIQLTLSATASSQLGSERIVETQVITYNDQINADTVWGNVYQSHTTTNNTYGQLGLATTTTTNDSIGMNVTRNTSDTTDSSLGDTLVLVNADTTNTNKTFTANNTAPNYTLSDNLTATKGNLTITGLGATTSTLNLNGHTGFNVGSGASLSLNDLTLSGGSGSSVTNSSNLTVNNSTIANSITLSNSGNLTLSGTNTLNTAVSGTGSATVNSGSTNLNAAMTQNNLTINNGATLTASANNLAISNAITNNGTLRLAGGTLSQSVNGNGTLALSANTTLAANKTISGNALNLSNKTLTVNNTANGAINVSAFSNSGTSGLNLANDAIQTATLGTVNLVGDVNYTLDINTANQTADKLIISGVSTDSTGKITINSFNVTSGAALSNITDKDFKVQILQAPNNNIQLALGSTASSQLGSERVIDTQITTTPAQIQAATGWGDIYQTTITEVNTYGQLGLATTTTTNDSIGMNVTRTTTDTSYTSMGDTLVLVNADTTNANKTFTATDTAPNYTLDNNLSATKGNLTITGLGATTSTLNLNGHTGFNVGSGASLSLNDLTLSGGSGSSVTNSSNLTVNNSTIANSITFSNSGNLTLSGTNTLNTAVSGTGSATVNNGSTNLNAAMTQNNLTINNGATLTASANNLAISNAITNNGTLRLAGGTLSQSVNGNGTLALSANTTLAANKTINVSVLNLGTKKLTADESSLHAATLANSGASALDIATGSIGTLATNNIVLNGDITTKIDINLTDKIADTVSTSSVDDTSTGKIVLDDFNVLGTASFADITDKNFKIQILQTPNDKLQLDLSATAISRFGGERVVQTDIDVEYDPIKAATSWSDIYQTHTTVTDTYGEIGLATTSTTNDSIGMNVTRQSSETTHAKTGDTLVLVAKDTTNAAKTFTATEDNPNYTVDASLATETAILTNNRLTVTGIAKETSALNLGNHSFVLAADSRLDLNNLTASTSRDVLVDGAGSLYVTASDITGNINLNSADIYQLNLNNTTMTGNLSLDGNDDFEAKLVDTTVNGNIRLLNRTENNRTILNARNTTVNGNVETLYGDQTVYFSGATNLNGNITPTQDIKVDVVVDNAQITLKENTFAQTNVSTAESVFNLNNDNIENYTFRSLYDDPRVMSPSIYNIDIDIAARTTDKITVLEDSSATITIGRINTLNGTFDDLPAVMTGNEFKVQILDAPNDDTQLKLGAYAKQQIAGREYEIDRITHNRDDVVTDAADWNDVFYHKTQDEVFYGRLGLVKTKTENDSIGIIPTESRMEEIITHEPLGDTLRLVNTNTEYTEKSFTTGDASARYSVNEDLGQTYGSLLIAGQKDGTSVSTIDFAGHNGFDIAENAAVSARNVIFTDSNHASEIKVQNGGTITLDNASINNVSLALDGKLNINNNQILLDQAVFGPEAELSLKVNTLSDFGKLSADRVTFTDTALLKVSLADKLVGFNQTEDIQLLQASDGNFAALREIFDNDAYYFEKKNDNGWYSIRLVKTAQDVVRENNGSQNNEETASAWVDHTKQTELELSAKLNKLGQDNPAAFIDSLTALAPNDVPVIQTVEADNGGLLDMVNMHLHGSADVIMPDNYAASQYRGQPLQYRNMPRPKKIYRPDYYNTGYTYGLSSGDLAHPAALWLNAYKGKSELKASGKTKGFDTDRTSFSAALEKQFTSAFKAGAGYAYESDSIDAFKRDVDVDMHRIFAYAKYQPYETFINGAISYGFASYKENKEVIDQKLNASYDTSTISAQTTVGYETDYITPEMGLRYYHIRRDEYTDGAKQKVAANDMNILRGVTGVRAGVDIGTPSQYTLRPELYGGVSYDLVSDSDDAAVTLPNGVTYNIQGESPDKLGIELGGGITAEFAGRFSLNAHYLGSLRKNYTSHTGIVGMRIKF